MYYGNVDLTKLKSREILNLTLPLDEFNLQPLVMYIQETLIKNHEDFFIKNICELIELAYQKKSFNKLWNFCIKEVCFNPNCLFESIKFLNLNPSILEIILKHDEFCI